MRSLGTQVKRNTKLAEKQEVVQERQNHSRRKRVTFEVEASEGTTVYVAGTFNDWDPEQHELEPQEDGTYSASILLTRGSHEYKFIIDDVWCVDPACPDWTPNGMGSLNSVIHIL